MSKTIGIRAYRQIEQGILYYPLTIGRILIKIYGQTEIYRTSNPEIKGKQLKIIEGSCKAKYDQMSL